MPRITLRSKKREQQSPLLLISFCTWGNKPVPGKMRLARVCVVLRGRAETGCHALLPFLLVPLLLPAPHPAPRHNGSVLNNSFSTSQALLPSSESAAAIHAHLYADETRRMCVLVWKPVKSIYGPNCQFS